jgi:hypothetical protein
MCADKNKPGREGKVAKTLQWRPVDGGFQICVTSVDKVQDKQASVSYTLTLPEYTLFEQLARSSMAPMLGFDVAWGAQ